MKTYDIHQANVTGLGARKFAAGLLEYFVNNQNISIQNIYVNGAAAGEELFRNQDSLTIVSYPFGSISRLFEIFFWKLHRAQKNELLVLGDLPLNTHAKQYVLCQQSLIFKKFSIITFGYYKFGLFKFIFKFFLKKNDVVLVQTNEMATKVLSVVNHGVEVQVLDMRSKFFGWPEFYRSGRNSFRQHTKGLNLVYPAAFYPHKNHHLLTQ